MKKQLKNIFAVTALLAVNALVVISTSCKKNSNNNQTTTTTTTGSNPAPVYGTMMDGEGNSYKTVIIGTQTWTAQNLKSTKYNDGTSITYCTDYNNIWGSYWNNTSSAYGTGAYCYYNNDTSNRSKYGCLYNWEAVKTGKLAPAGWHVADTTDFQTLYDYCSNKYGASNVANHLIAPTFTTGYSSDNATGFSAVPSGYRVGGGFNDEYAGQFAYFWTRNQWVTSGSSDYAFYAQITNNPYLIVNHRGVPSQAYTNSYTGLSVRLVKDNGGSSSSSIAGTYSVSESCSATGGVSFTSTITCTNSGCSTISISNFGDFGTSVILNGTVSGNAITIPAQTLSGITFSGAGTINSSSSVIITYTYTQGSTTNNCTDTYTK